MSFLFRTGNKDANLIVQFLHACVVTNAKRTKVEILHSTQCKLGMSIFEMSCGEHYKTLHTHICATKYEDLNRIYFE